MVACIDSLAQTRFLLNYKGLDYRTEWVEYPNVRTTFEPHLPTNSEGWAYSIPTITLPDGTWIMDSRKIADEIEKRYPNPSVHLDSPMLAKLDEIMPRLMAALAGIYAPLVPERLLNDASKSHFQKTRAVKFGMPLDQFKKEQGGQTAWTASKPVFDEVTALLKDNTKGPFFLGDEVSYTDLIWGSVLIFFQRIGADIYEELIQTIGDEAHLHNKLLLALDLWSVRNDY